MGTSKSNKQQAKATSKSNKQKQQAKATSNKQKQQAKATSKSNKQKQQAKATSKSNKQKQVVDAHGCGSGSFSHGPVGVWTWVGFSVCWQSAAIVLGYGPTSKKTNANGLRGKTHKRGRVRISSSGGPAHIL